MLALSFSSPANSASFSDRNTTKQPFALIEREPMVEREMPSNGSAPNPDGRSTTPIEPSGAARAAAGSASRIAVARAGARRIARLDARADPSFRYVRDVTEASGPGRGLAGSQGRVPRSRPGGEDEREQRVLDGGHGVALLGLPMHECAGPDAADVAALADLDGALVDMQPRVLVHLVVAERLAGGQVDRDHACGALVGVQHLGLAGFDGQRSEIPDVHAPRLRCEGLQCSARGAQRGGDV